MSMKDWTGFAAGFPLGAVAALFVRDLETAEDVAVVADQPVDVLVLQHGEMPIGMREEVGEDFGRGGSRHGRRLELV